MAKPNWKKQGLTREQGLTKQRRVDAAYVALRQKVAIPRQQFHAMLKGLDKPI